MQLTKKRKEILECLKQNSKTLSAKAIHTELPHLDLATIYRNLELFVAAGLIKRVHLTDTEAHYEWQPEPHHHAICSDCERVIHFTAPDKKIISLLNLPDNFLVEEIEIMVHGKHQKS